MLKFVLFHQNSQQSEIMLEDKDTDFDLWCEEKCQEQPTFKYWSMAIKIVTTYLVLMLSLREGIFEAYKSSLSAIMSYLFANDNSTQGMKPFTSMIC